MSSHVRTLVVPELVVDRGDQSLFVHGRSNSMALIPAVVSGNEVLAPIFDLIGKQTFYLGPFGNGSRIKFVANLLVAVHTLAAAEAHQLGSACGLDPDLVQEVIAAGVGSSAMFEIRGPMMVAGSYEPPSARLAIILKDASIIADHARSLGIPTPLLDAAVPLYQAAVDAGLGDLDAAALRQLLEDFA